MLCACAAVDVAAWFWAAAALCVATPFLLRAPGIGILSLALSFWTGFYLYEYRADYENAHMAYGKQWEGVGSVYAESGRSVLFKPEDGEWLLLLSPPDEFGFTEPLKVGQKYRISGKPYAFNPAKGPGLFDRKRWGYLNGAVAGISVQSATPLGPGDAMSGIYALSQRLRELAAGLMMQGAPPHDAAQQVVVSSVLGNKTESLPETKEAFLHSGCLHVFAVSGMQVGLVAVIIFMLFRLLRLPPVWGNLVSLPLLALYVFVTGMPASALRALIMVSAVVLAFVLRRKARPVNVLSLAFVTLCLINPLQVYQPGFQLSFGVLAAILAATAWVNREHPLAAPDAFIPTRIYTLREKALVQAEKWLRGGLIVSVGAWLTSIPLTMCHFGTWNLYSPLASLGLSFIVLPLMIFSLLGLVFCWWPAALIFFNSLAGLMGGAMLWMTQTIADLPCSFLSARPPAAQNEAMIVPLYEETYSVIIGNPALVLGSGTDNNVSFTLTPLMKARHVQPAGVLSMGAGKQERFGADFFLLEYPDAVLQDGSAENPYPAVWRFGNDNELSLLSLPGALPTGIRQDQCRPALWECHGRRVLLVGHAGFAGLLRSPDLKADVLVIGHHPRDPVMGPDWIEQTGASHVIFTTPYECPVPPGVKIYRLSETGVIFLKAAPDGITLTPWNSPEGD